MGKGEDELGVENLPHTCYRLLKNRGLSLSVHFYMILPATLSEAKIGAKSIYHAERDTPHGALIGVKVRIMDRLRSFEHTGGVNPNKRVVEVRQNAGSHGKSELLVHASASWRGRSMSTWPNFGASLG
jgi:hypothetical protein